jgi:glutathione S-transferase
VLWAIEEMGLKINLITMPFPPRVFHREFLKVTSINVCTNTFNISLWSLQRNVLGTIPYFEDHKTGACMTESCAIPQYLINTLDPSSLLAIQPHEPDYGSYLNWLQHADATITFPQTIVLRYTLQEPGVADNAAVAYGKWFIARLRMLDNYLKEENGSPEYLCGGRFTIADICVAYALFLGTTLQLPGDTTPLAAKYQPQTAAYMERMMARPSWAAAMAAQDKSAEEFEQHYPASSL